MNSFNVSTYRWFLPEEDGILEVVNLLFKTDYCNIVIFL